MADISSSMLAGHLEEHNRWRRGEGRYSELGVDSPITARQLGIVIDDAAKEIRKASEFLEWLDVEIGDAEEEIVGESSYGDG